MQSGAPLSPELNWRISLDRAWRSDPIRRQFEAETGLDRLADNEKELEKQALSGHMQTYHEQFLLWASRLLQMEDCAPKDVKPKLN